MPYSKIIITNSITPAAKPNPFDLSIGELTLNAADGKIFALNDSNEVVKLADKSYESRISNLETNPGVWGSIGGTLALQTDLTSALETKVNKTDITNVILNTESVTGGARVDLTAVNGSTASFDIVTSGSGLSVTTANDIVTLTHVNVTRTNTTATQSGVFGDTINVITGVSSNQRGHVTGVETSTLTLPNVQSLEDRLDALEYVPINITSFTVAPTTTIYEYSGNLYQPTFNWSTNTTPNTISLVSPYSVPSIGTGDTTYAEPIGEVQSYTTGAESSKSWTLSVTDSQNNTNSSTKTIKWVYPFYYGTDAADLSGELVLRHYQLKVLLQRVIKQSR